MALNRKKEKTSKPGVFRLEGGGWLVLATQRTPDGRRIYRREVLPAEASLAEAARRRAQLTLELDQEVKQAEREPPKSRVPSLKDYAERWLERKSTRLKASVSALYSDILTRRIIPILGEKPVDALTRDDVIAWIMTAEKQRKDDGGSFSRDTLQQWWRVTKTLLKDAAADFGAGDPTYRVQPPQSSARAVREKATLTEQSLQSLLDIVREEHAAWFAEVFVAAFTGMRPGELYGLKWPDLDEREGVIHIRRAVWRGKLGSTKTDDPREVPLTGALRRVLADHRRQMSAESNSDCVDGLIFPAETGGFRGPEALRNLLMKAAKKAGIRQRVTPQVLRRTFNTLLLEAGVNEIVLRFMMGHTDAAMTSRYAGVHADAKRVAVERLHSAVTKKEDK